MEEKWKDIKGYEGLYQVSNLGRVKSLERRVVVDSKGNTKLFKQRIKKQTPFLKNKKYLMTVLYKNNHGLPHQIHRLVAEAFIPNPQNLPCVNHKDYNPTNNCVDNLEWVTHQQNSLYSSENYSLAGVKKSDKKYGGYIYKHHKGYRFEASLKGERKLFYSLKLEEVKNFRDEWLKENKPQVYNYLKGSNYGN